MSITTTLLRGAAVLDLELKQDDRGFFARTFDRTAFADAGLEPLVEQCNLSFNHRSGTLRGMHYQVAPVPEAKSVRCTAGAIVDVIVHVRPVGRSVAAQLARTLTPEQSTSAITAHHPEAKYFVAR